MGQLWRWDWLNDARVDAAPAMTRTVIAVDPPVFTSEDAVCGIVVAGLGEDRSAYVLADRSVPATGLGWPKDVAKDFRDYTANMVVCEVNGGGDLVADIMRRVDDSMPIRRVRVTRGRWHRLEPIASLYAERRVMHVGAHPALEADMVRFGDGEPLRDPSRLDALSLAITELMLAREGNSAKAQT